MLRVWSSFAVVNVGVVGAFFAREEEKGGKQDEEEKNYKRKAKNVRNIVWVGCCSSFFFYFFKSALCVYVALVFTLSLSLSLPRHVIDWVGCSSPSLRFSTTSTSSASFFDPTFT